MRTVRRASGDRSSLPQKLLVILQVAVSVVLISGALLMARSLANLEHQNLGVATANRYVLRFDPGGAGYSLEQLPALYRRIEDGLLALPSATSVSFGRHTPLDGNMWGSCIVQQGHPTPGPRDECFSTWVRVSHRFLGTMAVPILRGRDFNESDGQGSTPVALVNQSFAQHFFPDQDPIGKHFGNDTASNSSAFEIVGVFADFKMTDPHHEVRPLFLRPLTQQYLGYTDPEEISTEASSMFVGSVILELARPQTDVEGMVRRVLAGIDPNLTIFYFSSYEAQVAHDFYQDRLITRLTGVFGALALLLASVGLYGVVSFLVARRTSEIGLRIAMGASRPRVIGMVLGGTLRSVLIGVILGIPLAYYLGGLTSGVLYKVNATNPLVYLVATATLVVSAAVAGFLPARRAALVDPIEALRED